MLPRRADLLLLALAVATVALVGAVLTRDPSPSLQALSLPRATADATASTGTAVAPSAASRPGAGASAGATASAAARATAVPALVLVGEGVESGHLAVAARTLRWMLGASLPLPPGPSLAARLAGRDVVVVQAAEGAPSVAATAVRQVRALAPAVRIVLVGPLDTSGAQLERQRDVLRTTATQTGADFVDPVGSRWVAALRPTPGPQALTPREEQAIGARLVTAVEGADKARAQRGAGPTPG